MRFLVLSTMLVVSSVFAGGEGASKKERPTLGSLAEVLKLTNIEASKGYPVHLRAQVTLYLPDARWLFLQDRRSGIYAIRPNPDVTMQAGDWIEVDGVTVHGGFAPNLELHTVKVLGHSPMPAPVKPRDKRYPIPESANLWSEARGRILRIKTSPLLSDTSLNFDLRLESGSDIPVMIGRTRGCNRGALVDADVVIQGVLGTMVAGAGNAQSDALFPVAMQSR